MNRVQRKAARDAATHAALLGVQNKADIHYTMNAPARWEGIAKRLDASKGEYPHWADCSSFVTWCLWQALQDLPDVVNGADWKAGYTGTMASRGRVIADHRDAVRGDAVLYGALGTLPFHTAIVIGHNNGLVVVSHGEETGPYIVPYDTWQVHSIRRYITSDLEVPDVRPTPRPHPQPQPHEPKHSHDDKIYQGAPVPNLIRKGSGQYLGYFAGPSNSHGGYYQGERPIIKMLQQRLIACGFVPGVTDVHSSWADGKFGKPTVAAVTRFQKEHMPQTEFFGQVWNDDWHKLFNL